MEFNSSAELQEAWLGGFGEQGVLGDVLRLFMKRLCGGVFYRNSAVRMFRGRTFPVPPAQRGGGSAGGPRVPGLFSRNVRSPCLLSVEKEPVAGLPWRLRKWLFQSTYVKPVTVGL